MKSTMVPLTLDSVVEIQCPYCGYPRRVEPDANYIVNCEHCEKEYKIYSMI